MQIPRLGYGCVQLTAASSLNEAKRLIECALHNKVNYFDVAPSYGKGYCEKILGSCLASSRYAREDYFIATKLGGFQQRSPWLPVVAALSLKNLQRKIRRHQPTNHPERDRGEKARQAPNPLQPYEISLEQVHRSIQRSLLNLNIKYVDVLLLHEALPDFLSQEAREYIFSLREDGVTKKIGIAANGVNYARLTQQQILGWDVLQYELGPTYPSHFDYPHRFPQLHHVVHSCIGSASRAPHHPHQALTKALTHNPNGTVLFSSLQCQHIEQNALVLEQINPT